MIRRALVVLSVLALAGCASGAKSAAKPATFADEEMPTNIIDAHSHTFGFAADNEPRPVDEATIRKQYFGAMKDAGVVASISHTSDLEKGWFDFKKEHVLHCAGMRPPIRLGALESGLKSGKYGCIKIYLGYVHRYANDAEYLPIYKLAEKYGVAVVFHTGDTYSVDARVKFADPMLIDDLAVKFRKVNFVIAHCGNPWVHTAAEIAYKNPNVYLDGSAFITQDPATLTEEQLQDSMIQPLKFIQNYVQDPTKLMFGSDYPITTPALYIKAFKRAIPREHWQAVFHDNAVRVFKLDQRLGIK